MRCLTFLTGLAVASMLLLSQATVAQISGYQGKRTLATYNLQYFPALLNPNANNNTGLAAFNVNHVLKGEYILTRKSSIGAQARFYRTTVEFGEDAIIYNAQVSGPAGTQFWPSSAYTIGTTDGFNSVEVTERGELSGYSIGSFYRFYGSKALAPLGNYFQVGLELMSYKVNPVGNALQNPSQVQLGGVGNATFRPEPGETVNFPEVQEDKRWSALAFTMDFGRQRVIFDRVVWNYGIQNGYIIAGSGVSGFQDLFVADNTFLIREYDES